MSGVMVGMYELRPNRFLEEEGGPGCLLVDAPGRRYCVGRWGAAIPISQRKKWGLKDQRLLFSLSTPSLLQVQLVTEP